MKKILFVVGILLTPFYSTYAIEYRLNYKESRGWCLNREIDSSSNNNNSNEEIFFSEVTLGKLESGEQPVPSEAIYALLKKYTESRYLPTIVAFQLYKRGLVEPIRQMFEKRDYVCTDDVDAIFKGKMKFHGKVVAATTGYVGINFAYSALQPYLPSGLLSSITPIQFAAVTAITAPILYRLNSFAVQCGFRMQESSTETSKNPSEVVLTPGPKTIRTFKKIYTDLQKEFGMNEQMVRNVILDQKASILADLTYLRASFPCLTPAEQRTLTIEVLGQLFSQLELYHELLRYEDFARFFKEQVRKFSDQTPQFCEDVLSEIKTKYPTKYREKEHTLIVQDWLACQLEGEINEVVIPIDDLIISSVETDTSAPTETTPLLSSKVRQNNASDQE